MNIKYSFNFGPKVEFLEADENETYLCEFFEIEDFQKFFMNNEAKLVYSFLIKPKLVATHYREWYTNWFIKISKLDKTTNNYVTASTHMFDLQNRNVRFDIEPNDSAEEVLWIDMIKKFCEEKECSFYIHSSLGILEQKELDEYYASYKIGRFDIAKNSYKKFGKLESAYPQVVDNGRYYDSYLNKTDWKDLNSEEIAADILDIDMQKESNNMKEKLIKFYSGLKKNKNTDAPNTFTFSFTDGPFVEISGKKDKTYEVSFEDREKSKIVYSTFITPGHWCKASAKYYVDWGITVKEINGTNSTTIVMDLDNRPCKIELNSQSLGDTLAWIPYVEEFRKKHNVKTMYCSTFWNDLFKDEYPNIIFTKPDEEIAKLYCKYKIGYFDAGEDDKDKAPVLPRLRNLQQAACDILGLEYREIKPKLSIKNKNRTTFTSNLDKYIVTAFHSTAQCKYWNNKKGWSDLVKKLNEKGYDVINISKEEDGYMGNEIPSSMLNKSGNFNIQDRISDIYNAEYVIGTSTGLLWLAWALDKKVVMISGITDVFNEFSSKNCRVINKSVCNSCFNDKYLKFDKADWNYCPRHKGTDRMFECTKTISADDVISQMESYFDFK